MHPSNRRRARAAALLIPLLGVGSLLLAGRTGSADPRDTAAPAVAQTAEPDRVGVARVGTPGLEYDRNAQLIAHRRAGADSGWRRGEEIFYMRCWICHSEYVIAADHFPAPSLRQLPERRDEAYVKAIVRSGTTRMPRYAPETMSEEELDDLVTFLMEKCGTSSTGGGCFDEHNPPPNPLYQYEVTGLQRPPPRSERAPAEAPSGG